ncbi:hypothetical protein LguiB_031976 [Lonicera macranthoides]
MEIFWKRRGPVIFVSWVALLLGFLSASSLSKATIGASLPRMVVFIGRPQAGMVRVSTCVERGLVWCAVIESEAQEAFDLMGLMEHLPRSIHAYDAHSGSLCQDMGVIHQKKVLDHISGLVRTLLADPLLGVQAAVTPLSRSRRVNHGPLSPESTRPSFSPESTLRVHLEQEEREQREKMEKQKEKDVAEKKSKAAKASKGLATPHYNPQNSPNPQNFGHVDGLRVSAKNGVFVTQNSATAPQSPLTVYQCIANKCQQKEHCHSSKQSQSMPSKIEKMQLNICDRKLRRRACIKICCSYIA